MPLVEPRSDGIDCQAGGVIGLEAHLRHEEAAEIIGIVGLGLATGDLAGDPCCHCLAERRVDVETGKGIAEAVDADLHRARRLVLRALADQVHDAAGIGAAIEHRSRAFQHLDRSSMKASA